MGGITGQCADMGANRFPRSRPPFRLTSSCPCFQCHPTLEHLGVLRGRERGRAGQVGPSTADDLCTPSDFCHLKAHAGCCVYLSSRHRNNHVTPRFLPFQSQRWGFSRFDIKHCRNSLLNFYTTRQRINWLLEPLQ